MRAGAGFNGVAAVTYAPRTIDRNRTPSMPATPRLVRTPLALLLALAAATVAAAPDDARIAKLFAANCAQCHLRPGVGAPMAGAQAEWRGRLAQGEDAMLRNVVEGIRGMPPLGYCGACTEAELRALTRMMTGTAP